MKILSSEIAMASGHSYLQKYEKSERLRTWVDSPDKSVPLSQHEVDQTLTDNVFLTKSSTPQSRAKEPSSSRDGSAAQSSADSRLLLLKAVIEAITGKRLVLLDPSTIEDPGQAQDTAQATPEQTGSGGQQTDRAGWGVEYTSQESYQEEEHVLVSADGSIKTKDGAEIPFSVRLRMDRQLLLKSGFEFRAGDARKVDPLVINFGGNAAELTDAKFAFDLNTDGKTENISFVRPGSGLLVIDKNLDGKINDGSELFGPSSGDGFNELARYDEDRNGWIDEGDTMYSRLCVWTKGADGKDFLTPLTESDVGAINLSPIVSQFDERGSDNRLDGQVRQTGIYVDPEGNAKTIQQLDLTV